MTVTMSIFLWETAVMGLVYKYAVSLIVEGTLTSSKTRMVLRYYSLFETVTITSLKNDKTAINILAL